MCKILTYTLGGRISHPFSLAKKTNYTLTAAELRQAACRGRRHLGDNGECAVGKLGVLGTSGGAGGDEDDLEASLFSLAVLSGEKAAVEFVADFVVKNAHDEQKVGKLRAARLRALPSLARG